MDQTVPEPSTGGTTPPTLDAALYNGAAGNYTQAMAVALLCDIPGQVYREPGFEPYVLRIGDRFATVSWDGLADDLADGDHELKLDKVQLAMLLLACSLAGVEAPPIGPLLAAVHRRDGSRGVGLFIGAIQYGNGQV